MARYFGRPGSGPQLQAELLPRVEAELSTQVDPMPGARQLLEHLVSRIPTAVATNSPRAMLTAALKSSGLEHPSRYPLPQTKSLIPNLIPRSTFKHLAP